MPTDLPDTPAGVASRYVEVRAPSRHLGPTRVAPVHNHSRGMEVAGRLVILRSPVCNATQDCPVSTNARMSHNEACAHKLFIIKGLQVYLQTTHRSDLLGNVNAVRLLGFCRRWFG